MFQGTVFHTIDDKGRVLVPPRFRLSLGERFVVTFGLRRTLSLYTADAWHGILAKLKDHGDFNPSANTLRTFFAGGAEEVTTDAQGRLTLPAPHREFAGLENEVVSVGTVSKVDIWAKSRWQAFYENVDDARIEEAIRELNL